MTSHKANFAGLISPGQQSEMKAILAGAWPPLKPLPVFKYETAEFRATIDFDRKRGEWMCRKTSLPSNQVQELRGGLREITMALPHGEAEASIEEAEHQERESKTDMNRRLQAMHDWRENYANGARYFELRNYVSDSQRSELDDSLRLTLTARQLQFNAKNVANVFDDLAIAGGRFAALMEFAKRNKDNHGADPLPQGEGVAHEAEHTNSLAPELPALSIKDVSLEHEQTPLAERAAPTLSQQFETEIKTESSEPEIVGADAPSLVENLQLETHHSPAFAGVAAQPRTSQPFTPDRVEGWFSRFAAFKISAFQVKVFASLLLFATATFAIGLTVGRGVLGRRLREAAKSTVAVDATPPAPPVKANKPASRTSTSSAVGSDESAGAARLGDATLSGEKSKESTRGSESLETRSTGSDSPLTAESKPPAGIEFNSERRHAGRGAVRDVSPRAGAKLVRSHKSSGQVRSALRSPAPYKLTSATGAGGYVSRPSTLLVSVPSRGSQPFRVSFPERTIAATSSLAMASELSVLVGPGLGPGMDHKSARLEAGELVSFVWPRYATPSLRPGFAEVITISANIGPAGEVQGVKFLSGSVSLLPATTQAIRQWRYRPTLLDKRPVQAQQDVTIEFGPPQTASLVASRRPAHNEAQSKQLATSGNK